MRTLVLVCLTAASIGCALGCTAMPASKEVARGIASDSAGTYYDDATADRDMSKASADPGRLAPMPADPSRKVIYNADFTVRVTSLEDALERTRAIAAETGGYVQKERNKSVTLRVPAARFAHAVERIGKLGRIVTRELTADDVTEQYVDLEIRLKVKQDYLDQLNRLYEKGGALKDLLEIKREIDKVTEEIERLKGKLRFLSDRIAMSTIWIEFEVAAMQIDRRFRLPFSWLETLGIENLLIRNRGERR